MLASCAGDAAGGGATHLRRQRWLGPARQGQVTLRADSGFYSRKVIRACRRGNARFSVTVRMNPSVRRAIAAIPEQA